MYIEMGGVYKIQGQNVFKRKIYIEVDKINDIRKKFNNTEVDKINDIRKKFNNTEEDKINDIRKKFNNTDVYATIFQYNNEDQNNSDLYGPLYIDLDMDFNNDKEYTKLKQDLSRIVTYLNLQYGIPTKFIRFYFTGKKGFHLIISQKVFNLKPNKDLNVYYKEIAKELNDNTINKIVDTRIYDKKRLLRLPNSINSKTGLYKVPILYSDITKFSYEDILDYAKNIKQVEFVQAEPIEKAINKINDIISNLKNLNAKKAASINIPKNVDLSKITFPKCIQEIYKNGVTEGNRNNTTIILASALFQKGIDIKTGLSMVHKWNLEKNNPSLSDNEIDITVNSAYQQVTSGRRYGCSSIKDMGLCIGKECKIYK